MGFGDNMWSEVPPLVKADDDGSHQTLCYAIGLPFEEIERLARDQDDGTAGWAVLLDPWQTPVKALDWLACLVGANVDRGADETTKRTAIAGQAAWRRGTLDALVQAALPWLTGTRRLVVEEKWGGDAYAILVATYDAETIDATALEAAVRKQKAAGLVLTYQLRAHITYDDLASRSSNYGGMQNDYNKYNDMSNVPV